MRVRFPLTLRALAASFLLLLMPAQGSAAIEISFYSHESGADFSHSFVAPTGTDGRSGERIDANYGLAATVIGPDILFGAVKGRSFRDWRKDAQYFAFNQSHFSFELSEGGKFAAALGATGFDPPIVRSLAPLTKRRR
ncbi:MAG: hypothetical protein M3N39_05215 [Pseudomonadota bacterium]|nr:hypothetical protein [Pseudomonadota bacterium]